MGRRTAVAALQRFATFRMRSRARFAIKDFWNKYRVTLRAKMNRKYCVLVTRHSYLDNRAFLLVMTTNSMGRAGQTRRLSISTNSYGTLVCLCCFRASSNLLLALRPLNSFRPISPDPRPLELDIVPKEGSNNPNSSSRRRSSNRYRGKGIFVFPLLEIKLEIF